ELDLDDEQRSLRDEARRFLEREAGIAYARAMMEDERGFTDEAWKKLASLGWTALPFSEDDGGLGQGFVALAILLAEMGRVVLPGPYFSTVVLAGHAILEAGSEAQRKELLPTICSGESIAAFAPDETIRVDGDTLLGEARYVMNAA